MRTVQMVMGLSLLCCGAPEEGENFGVVGGIDTSRAGLVSFSKSRGYASWTGEPAVHKSAGPHGQVRTFFNDALTNSLQKSASVHPFGSVVVKELFEDDGVTLNGHAVMLKVRDSTDKDSWLFFEGFKPEYQNPFYGRGHESCHGCHAAGKDYIVSELP